MAEDKVCISQLVRSRRRTIALMITADAKLKVCAPFRASLSYIEQIVGEKSGWIRRKIAQAGSRPKRILPEFVDGAGFLYLGQLCPLRISDHNRIYFNEKLFFPRELLPQARQEMEFWYRQAAAKIIPERVEHFAGIMGVMYESIRMSSAKSRWGSCGPKNDLSFSWKLVMAPLEVIDYVVVHELVHLIVRNHSGMFWDKVREFYPDYFICRRWLKDNMRLAEFAEEQDGRFPRK